MIYLALADEEDRLLGFCQLYPSFSSLSLSRLDPQRHLRRRGGAQLVADHLLQHDTAKPSDAFSKTTR